MAATSPDRAKSETAQPKPRRFGRWFRFSLATMFVVLTVFCLLLGFYAERARRQSEAVAMIRAKGGIVGYDHDAIKSRAGLWVVEQEPLAPVWLREVLGIDFFSSVIYVDLRHRQVSDADLEHMASLHSLGYLYLSDRRITSEGVKHLAGLRKLERLELWESQIDDDGLKYLARLPLTHLHTKDSRITGLGLVHFRGNRTLTHLSLQNAPVAEDGVAQLSSCGNLCWLCLVGTKVSPEAASELKKALPNCDIRLE